MFLKVERLISWLFYLYIDSKPCGAWGIGIKLVRMTAREKSSCRFLYPIFYPYNLISFSSTRQVLVELHC